MKLEVNTLNQTISSKALAERKPTRHTDMLRAIKLSFSNIGQNLDDATARHEGIQVLRDDRGNTSEILLSVKNAVFVISKWDDKLRMQVMDELEISKTVTYGAKEVADSSVALLEMAKAFGFKGNQALLSADKATKTLTGYSPLALMGQTQLISENKDVHMTVTELGSELNLKASEVNNLLRDQGFQEKLGMVMGKKGKLIGGHWKPTDKALGYCEYLDTHKKHSDGTPVKQIKWYSSILDRIDK